MSEASWRGRIAAGLLGALMLLPSATAAADRPWASYAEVQSIFARFDAVPAVERSHLLFRVRTALADRGSSADRVRLKLLTRTGARPVPISADGFLNLPTDPELLRENPVITTNLPVGTALLLHPEIIFAPPPAAGISMAALAARLDQANKAVRAQSGMWAMFAPRARAVELVFTDPRTEIVLRSHGTTTRLPLDRQGRVIVTPDRRNADAELLYAAGPALLRPVFPGSMVLRVDSD